MTKTDSSEAVSASTEASFRANLYSLLSLVFGKEPTSEMIEILADDSVSSALRDLGVDLDFAGLHSQVEMLGHEYCYLFIGPGPHLPPFESAVLGAKTVKGEQRFGQLLGERAMKIDENYERFGLELGGDLKDQPDHIAAELAFMGYLCRMEATVVQAGGDPSSFREEQARFLKEHLGAWASTFCKMVRNSTDNPYYKMFSGLTMAFIESELSEI